MRLSYIIGRAILAGVRYDPWNAPNLITIWEDRTGGCFMLSERSLVSWNRSLERYNAGWFMPFLERLATGEAVSIEEMDARHEELFGKPMERIMIGDED